MAPITAASIAATLSLEDIQDIVGSPGRLPERERERIRDAFARHVAARLGPESEPAPSGGPYRSPERQVECWFVGCAEATCVPKDAPSSDDWLCPLHEEFVEEFERSMRPVEAFEFVMGASGRARKIRMKLPPPAAEEPLRDAAGLPIVATALASIYGVVASPGSLALTLHPGASQVFSVTPGNGARRWRLVPPGFWASKKQRSIFGFTSLRVGKEELVKFSQAFPTPPVSCAVPWELFSVPRTRLENSAFGWDEDSNRPRTPPGFFTPLFDGAWLEPNVPIQGTIVNMTTAGCGDAITIAPRINILVQLEPTPEERQALLFLYPPGGRR